MTPRYGKARVAGQRYRRRPGVYAVLMQGDSVLLTHQAAPEPEYQLPGGGIDPGETVLRALHREVLEETGWRIADARRLGVYRRFAYMPEYDLWAEKICHIYIGRPLRQVCAPTEPGHAAIWSPIADASTLLASAGDRAFLQAVAAGAQRLP